MMRLINARMTKDLAHGASMRKNHSDDVALVPKCAIEICISGQYVDHLIALLSGNPVNGLKCLSCLYRC